MKYGCRDLKGGGYYATLEKEGAIDMSHLRLQIGDKAHDFDFQTPWSPRQNFYETVGNNPAILVFLRYQGCPVCQMEMAHLKREIGLFTQKETKVFVFLQSSPETVASAANEADWPFFHSSGMIQSTSTDNTRS